MYSSQVKLQAAQMPDHNIIFFLIDFPLQSMSLMQQYMRGPANTFKVL